MNEAESYLKHGLEIGDIFTVVGHMNPARPSELQQFRVMKDGYTSRPIFSDADILFLKKRIKNG